MIIEQKALDNSFGLPIGISPEETVYFDIETTGFSADVTALYLIGCIYFEDGEWQLIQWFAEDNKSEKEALSAFSDFIKDKKYLICYNGTTFDLPYLTKKYEKHSLTFEAYKYEIIDFYRVFSSYRKFLGLSGLKQKEVEAYLGIIREDKFSGGELIEWYSKYLKLRFSDSSEKEEIYKTLILHNSDDLAGLARLTKLYNFIKELETLINSGDELEIDCIVDDTTGKIILSTKVDFDILRKDELRGDGYSCCFIAESTANRIDLTLDMYETELKLFYKDYKNYYYLPKEDMVVHKSLAAFVDKENKEKAIASNCYTRHKGHFIKLPKATTLPVFKSEYANKTVYTLVNEKLLESKESLSAIFRSFLRYLIKRGLKSRWKDINPLFYHKQNK